MWAGMGRERAGHLGGSQQLLSPCGWLVPCTEPSGEPGVGSVGSGGRVQGPLASVTAGGNLPGWRGRGEAWGAERRGELKGGLRSGEDCSETSCPYNCKILLSPALGERVRASTLPNLPLLPLMVRCRAAWGLPFTPASVTGVPWRALKLSWVKGKAPLGHLRPRTWNWGAGEPGWSRFFPGAAFGL